MLITTLPLFYDSHRKRRQGRPPAETVNIPSCEHVTQSSTPSEGPRGKQKHEHIGKKIRERARITAFQFEGMLSITYYCHSLFIQRKDSHPIPAKAMFISETYLENRPETGGVENVFTDRYPPSLLTDRHPPPYYFTTFCFSSPAFSFTSPTMPSAPALASPAIDLPS